MPKEATFLAVLESVASPKILLNEQKRPEPVVKTDLKDKEKLTHNTTICHLIASRDNCSSQSNLEKGYRGNQWELNYAKCM